MKKDKRPLYALQELSHKQSYILTSSINVEEVCVFLICPF